MKNDDIKISFKEFLDWLDKHIKCNNKYVYFIDNAIVSLLKEDLSYINGSNIYSFLISTNYREGLNRPLAIMVNLERDTDNSDIVKINVGNRTTISHDKLRCDLYSDTAYVLAMLYCSSVCINYDINENILDIEVTDDGYSFIDIAYALMYREFSLSKSVEFPDIKVHRAIDYLVK